MVSCVCEREGVLLRERERERWREKVNAIVSCVCMRGREFCVKEKAREREADREGGRQKERVCVCGMFAKCRRMVSCLLYLMGCEWILNSLPHMDTRHAQEIGYTHTHTHTLCV